MNFVEIVKVAEKKIEETINLQDQLYSLDSESLDTFKEYILNSSFIKSRESLSILLRCIDKAFNARPLSFSFYLEVIKLISNSIRSNFTSYELFTDLIQNNYLRYKLYELGFIKITTILFYLKKTQNDLPLFFIFAFEVKINDPRLYTTYTCQSYEFRKYLSSITPEQHSILRSKGLNQEKVALLIRSDDVVGFQKVHSSTNLNLDTKINSNYENCQFSERNPSLIEYSALFGAVNVFKYLLLNGATLTENLPQFAVTGGNYEIIHILEQNGSKFNNLSALNKVIKFHRNELVEYINESLEVDFSIESLRKSLKFYNLSIFFEILNKKNFKSIPEFEKSKENLMSLAVKCGYVDIVETFLGLIENSEEKKKLLLDAVNYRRFDVFKIIYLSVVNNDHFEPDNGKLFLTAALNGHITILQFLTPYLTGDCFEIFDEMGNSVLNLAASYGDLENFQYIISLHPTISQLNHRNVYGILFIN